MHMCVAYACCEVVLSFKERSAVAAFRSHSSSTSNNSKVGWVSARQQLQSNRQFWKNFALSQTFAVSIVAAVASLEYLEVSFEQAILGTPCGDGVYGDGDFTEERTLAGVGEFDAGYFGWMVTAGAEPTFHAKGLALVLASMVARATKSCLQELLVSSAESPSAKEEKMDSSNQKS